MKLFQVGRPVASDTDYCVDRSDQIDSFVTMMLAGTFVLLHAHRQAGKTSMIKPIAKSLIVNDGVVININLQLFSEDRCEQSFWPMLHTLMKTEYSEIVEFSDASEFFAAMSAANFNGKRLFIILDEIDRLLNLPKIRDSLLSALRAIKIINVEQASSKQYALTSVLGIGVFQVVNLTSISSSSSHYLGSPFNVSQAVRLSQPSFDAVIRMFACYGDDIGVDLTKYAEDIFGRSGGHLGFTSILGQVLMRWVQAVGTHNMTLGGWVAHLTYTSGYNDILFESSTVRCIWQTLHGCPVEVKDVVMRLLHGEEVIPDPSGQSVAERSIVDDLESQGIVVRDHTTTSTLRFTAPLLRVVLYSIFVIPDARLFLPQGITLPLFRDGGRVQKLDMVECLRQALPYLDRSAIYSPGNLKADSNPTEFAYHFELFRVLAQMSSRSGWQTISEARNAAGHSRKRLDLLVSYKEQKFGFEVVADANSKYLHGHYTDQVEVYIEALDLSRMLIINFVSVIPLERPSWWFIAGNPKVTVVHVHLPYDEPLPVRDPLARDAADLDNTTVQRDGTSEPLPVPPGVATATIMHSLHARDDDKISLLSHLRNDVFGTSSVVLAGLKCSYADGDDELSSKSFSSMKVSDWASSLPNGTSLYRHSSSSITQTTASVPLLSPDAAAAALTSSISVRTSLGVDDEQSGGGLAGCRKEFLKKLFNPKSLLKQQEEDRVTPSFMDLVENTIGIDVADDSDDMKVQLLVGFVTIPENMSRVKGYLKDGVGMRFQALFSKSKTAAHIFSRSY